MSNWKQKLEEAKDLLDSGIISQDDFNELKDDLLQQVRDESDSNAAVRSNNNVKDSEEVSTVKQPRLVITKGLGDSEEKWTFIASDSLIAGRAFGQGSEDLDLPLTAGVILDWTIENGTPKDPNLQRTFRMSVRHCTFSLTEGNAYLIDNSTNGTFVDGKKLEGNDPYILGDVHTVGIADVITLNAKTISSSDEVNAIHIYCNEVRPNQNTVLVSQTVGLYLSDRSLVEQKDDEAPLVLMIDESNQFYLKNYTLDNCSVDGKALLTGEVHQLEQNITLLECDGEVWVFDTESSSVSSAQGEENQADVEKAAPPVSHKREQSSTNPSTEQGDRPSNGSSVWKTMTFVLGVVVLVMLLSGDDESIQPPEVSLEHSIGSKSTIGKDEILKSTSPEVAEQPKEDANVAQDQAVEDVTVNTDELPVEADATDNSKTQEETKPSIAQDGQPDEASGDAVPDPATTKTTNEVSPDATVVKEGEETTSTEQNNEQNRDCSDLMSLKQTALAEKLDEVTISCLEQKIQDATLTVEDKKTAALLLIVNVASSKSANATVISKYLELFDGQFDAAYKDFTSNQ